jgi:NADPH:quinone reductase-like Zn-dependent oxidoreductase
VLQEAYGSPDVVRVADVPEPTPADDEVLLDVRAVSLNGSDRENLAGRPLYSRVAGLRRPRNPVPGSDVAGVVVTVGSAVTGFVPGDEVFGELPGYRGGLAERVATSPRTLALKPPELSFVSAASIPQAGCIAWRALQGVSPGDHVLVNGAGGAGGAFVVGLARHLRAEVTAVDLARKGDHLISLGADHTIAADEEDWASHRDRYDRIVDLVAHRAPWRVHRALRRGGRYLMVGGRTDLLLTMPTLGALIGWARGRRVGVLVAPQSAADLAEATALVASGVVVPVIDAVLPLEQAPAAFARLAAGANLGKIVIEVG